jgi:hypothetical protein
MVSNTAVTGIGIRTRSTFSWTSFTIGNTVIIIRSWARTLWDLDSVRGTNDTVHVGFNTF